MENKNFITLSILGVLLAGSACKKNPIDRLSNPVPDGAVNGISGTYFIYDDDLKTGGGLAFIPGGENQSADVLDNSQPQLTLNQIRYSWNGGPVFDYEHGVFQYRFAGFNFPVSIEIDDLPTTPARDLSRANYTAVKLWVRGTLSDRTWLRIDGPDTSPSGAHAQINSRRQGDISGGDFVLTNDWQEITLPVPLASNFSTIKTFITITIQFAPPFGTTSHGGGGTVYVDNIRYVQ